MSDQKIRGGTRICLYCRKAIAPRTPALLTAGWLADPIEPLQAVHATCARRALTRAAQQNVIDRARWDETAGVILRMLELATDHDE